MPNVGRQRAAELHNLPEHAHESAAVRSDKTEHPSGQEATRMARERAAQQKAAMKKNKQNASGKPK